LLGKLKRLALAFNVPVILTNQVIENFGPNSQFIPFIPWSGPELAHFFDIRLFLKRLFREQRHMRVEACPWLPKLEEDFYLTTEGLCDNENGR